MSLKAYSSKNWGRQVIRKINNTASTNSNCVCSQPRIFLVKRQKEISTTTKKSCKILSHLTCSFPVSSLKTCSSWRQGTVLSRDLTIKSRVETQQPRLRRTNATHLCKQFHYLASLPHKYIKKYSTKLRPFEWFSISLPGFPDLSNYKENVSFAQFFVIL